MLLFKTVTIRWFRRPCVGWKYKPLNQCIINNSLGEGILSIQSSILAVNCLLSNCGQNIVIGQGGNYQFDYCTVASYSTLLLSHQLPVLTVSNTATDGNQIFTGDLTAVFTNCIFWGSEGVPDEAISKQGKFCTSGPFDHSILKQQELILRTSTATHCFKPDPEFTATVFKTTSSISICRLDPRLWERNKYRNTDRSDGNSGALSQSDLGCYERQ
jgi:hypothetical protein